MKDVVSHDDDDDDDDSADHDNPDDGIKLISPALCLFRDSSPATDLLCTDTDDDDDDDDE